MSKILLIILFILSLCFAFLGERKPRKLYVWILLGFLVLICTFKPGSMADYTQYLRDFNSMRISRFEVSYQIIKSFVKSYSLGFKTLIFTYAIISVSIKLYAVSQMAKYFWLSIALWLSNLFVVHDMIQIRAAVAVGLVLLMIKYLVDKDYWKYLLCLFIAVCFHTSAILCILLPFFSISQVHGKLFFWIIPLSYLVYFATHSLIPFDYLIKLELFQDYSHYVTNYNEDTNIFAFSHIMRCFLCMGLWLGAEKFSLNNKYFLLSLKTFTLSCVFYVILSDVIVAALRCSELFRIASIIVIPFYIKLIPKLKKDYSIFIPIIISIVQFYLTFNSPLYWYGIVN